MNDDERAYNLGEFVAAGGTHTHPGAALAASVGAAAPSFEVRGLDGAVVRLDDFRHRRHVVIMAGAVTSPLCAFEVPAFNQLQQEYESRGVSFFLLYTRESHPAENYPAHASMDQKIAHARDLRRLENVHFPILVDHLDGRVHRAYGAWPNALFVVHKDGRLIFRSNMANHAELRQFLEDLLNAERVAAEGGRVLHQQYSERVVAHEADRMTHRRVYERAGPKAFEDYWARRPENRDRWP